jgi:SAM-dependent methyltransferase
MPKEMMSVAEATLDTKRTETMPTASTVGAVGIKINLGCGKNKLNGWENHDDDVDITKPLPWQSDSVAFILAEHVMEHIPLSGALDFLEECYRVLKHNGVVRIAVPSLVQAMDRGTPEYFSWVHKRKWAKTPDLVGALGALIRCHGHQTAWDVPVLRAVIAAASFQHVMEFPIGQSHHLALRGVEGHGKVITDDFNEIETIVVEATKV